ncbi:MAG: tRNA uridine-5-carboxymethylaminomethyl(34) synthesis enzyme MnmG [Phycisphaerales bacterium]|nr:tRNA uridine-5-carboxymethylaminomethyl(34) synthesis enzyme MnmG [Phycisphaerales bacterium]
MPPRVARRCATPISSVATSSGIFSACRSPRPSATRLRAPRQASSRARCRRRSAGAPTRSAADSSATPNRTAATCSGTSSAPIRRRSSAGRSHGFARSHAVETGGGVSLPSVSRAPSILVIGGGHAGVEAAVAAARVLAPYSGRVTLVTMDPSRIGAMSCNPAIGGLAKGQMVREIDALGGIMGLAADATGIMFKVLNASRGPAVRGPRCQSDKYAYAAEVQRLLSGHTNIEVLAGTVDEIVVDDGRAVGAVVAGACPSHADRAAIEHNLLASGPVRPVYAQPTDEPSATIRLPCDAIVLTTGTFMRALMHTGASRTPGGRVGEGSAVGISKALRDLGFELGRLKTGTPPRLRRQSLDWERLPPQHGDARPVPFSDLSPEGLPGARFPRLRQIECRVTETNAAIHDLIRANLDRAPMYSGQIEAECGPRYCPSIEDKVVRFGDRDAHHVFLEPESLHSDEIYCNGISTSLPAEVQDELVRGMPGCTRAEILRHGYAVEYDMVWPHQIDATGMTKRVEGLFLAGQINGTSGYEEAAGQGLVAGLNAARLALGQEPVRLGRDQAYIGVMMDDLVTKTPREPYRMFTSRAEHRLLLRADNADARLTPHGRAWGLVDDERWRAFEARERMVAAVRAAVDRNRVEGRPLRDVLRRPEVTLDDLRRWLGGAIGRDTSAEALERVLVDMRYDGYVQRANAEIRRHADSERLRLPEWLDPMRITGLRREAADTLVRFRPATLGQASRLAGINPADVMLIAVAVRRGKKRGEARSA